jgi:hypothetical protein
MNILLIFILFLNKFNCLPEISKKIIENESGDLKGTFTINSIYKKNSFISCDTDKLIISQKKGNFDIIETKPNCSYIICRDSKKIIGLDEGKGEEYVLYSNLYKDNIYLNIWKLIKIKDNLFFIKSEYNQKYLMFNGKEIILENLDKNSESNKTLNNSYVFRIIKLYEEIGKLTSHQMKMIENEPIDLFMKYIDLTDKNLKREGIKQIYKDYDNEELRYSLRSIDEYLPWIRKIFIVMPNEKVKFLKPYEEIKEKIVYVNDKEFLGYDSANIFAFSFNLYKMEKFGISKNFIYMEDDYFIGKPLKKSDFFYYDYKENKIYPYVINTIFTEMNKKEILFNQKKMYKKRKSIKPHSHIGWNFSIMNTDKYFLERYKIPIIKAKFTHCAVAENFDDLKEIFNEIQDYKYINESLFSKTRHVLTLNQPEFVNLYQLNIKHRKVHKINNSYISIERAQLSKLNIELFVLNTGGDHKPSQKHYINLKKVMKERFPKPTKYEIINTFSKEFYELGITWNEFFELLIILLILILFIKIKSIHNKYSFLKF